MRHVAGTVAVVLLLLCAPSRGAIPADARSRLEESKYVYVSSQRKDGKFGRPAEIWFLYHPGAVYVASPPTAWRVRRIRAGRALAKIAVGAADGPSFLATGAVVKDVKIHPILFSTYAKKYGDGWETYAERFRTGLTDGSRVLIKYTPK
ncbi:MAG: hypothetical protein QOD06_974 [Candidatus Binatota bacterium]|nr:hypothetical protein [Candidatus Binatota bacterium]